tara:strand:+ start:54965 stop:55969 length:1005 start_codon:yes stop_codon:yes gene_type:complete
VNEESAAPASRRKRIIVIAVVVVVLAVVILGLWLASRPAPQQLQGMVDAEEVNVATKALARVEKLMAEEGQRVEAGAVLATLSSPEITGAQAQAQGALDAARAIASATNEGPREEDIATLRSTWQAAQAAADLAAETSRRTQNLYAEGVVAAQRRDEAVAARDSSARMAEAARLQYQKALAGARRQTKAAADAQVRIAQAGAQTAEAMESETRLVSPIAGEVARKLVQPGEIVSPVLPAYQVLDIDHPWVSVNLREDQYSSLSTGTVLRGHIPALDRDAEFRVYLISPRGDFATWRATREASGYDVRTFEVRLRPVEPIAELRPGMSVLFDWPQ